MTIVQVLTLSVVEGLTEFLPISSTGHLILISKLLNIPQTDFVKSFEIIIQFGAILAVVYLYRKILLQSLVVWQKIIMSFIPTAIIGVVFYKFVKQHLLGNYLVTIIALFTGGVIIIVLEKYYKDKRFEKSNIGSLTTKQSLLIGLFQSIAMIPGVSRSAATIFGGIILGLEKDTSVEFSFLLAIPTMFAATFLDLYKNSFHFTQNELLILALGFAGAFFSALVAVKYFLGYIKNHSFVSFGIYRIILAVVFLLFF